MRILKGKKEITPRAFRPDYHSAAVVATNGDPIDYLMTRRPTSARAGCSKGSLMGLMSVDAINAEYGSMVIASNQDAKLAFDGIKDGMVCMPEAMKSHARYAAVKSKKNVAREDRRNDASDL